MLFVDFLNKVLNRKSDKSLLLKIVITFFVLSESILISTTYLTNLTYLQNLKESTFDKVVSNRIEKETRLQNWILSSQNQASTITNLPDIRISLSNLLKNNLDDIDYIKSNIYLKNNLKEFIDRNPQFDSIFILDNNDKVLVSVDNQIDNSSRIVNQPFDKTYKPLSRAESVNTTNIINSQENTKTNSFYLSFKDYKPIIVFVIPIFNDFGTQLADLIVNIKLDQLNNLLAINQDNLSAHIQTYLIAKLNNKPSIIAGELQKLEIEDEKITSLGIDNALRGEHGKEEYKNHNGTYVLASYNWIENLNIAVISEVNKENTFEPAIQSFRDSALTSTGLILLITLIFYIFIKNQIDPISKITDIALAIANDNLEARFPVSQKSEFDTLAIALNQFLNRFRSLNLQVADAKHIFSQQVYQSTELIQNFIDLSNEGVAFLDRRDRVLQINAILAEIFSICASEVIGSHCEDIFPLEISNLIKSRRSPNQEQYCTELSIPYQKIRYKVTVSKIFCKSPDSLEKTQFLGTIVIVYALGELVHSSYLQVQSQASIDPNQSIVTTKDISYRIRTPMTSLLGFLKLTQRKLEEIIFPKLNSVDERTKRTINQIQDNLEIMISEGTQIAKSIEVVLQDKEISNYDSSSDLPQTHDRFLVSELFNQLNLELTQLFHHRNTKLIFDADIKSTEIEGDFEELKYVFTNLLTRTANFGDLRIAIFQRMVIDDQLVVTLGKVNSLVDREQVSSITSNLYNSIKATGQRNLPSKGMGLMIIQEILQKYSGLISVEWINISQVHYRFYVLTLPCAKANN